MPPSKLEILKQIPIKRYKIQEFYLKRHLPSVARLKILMILKSNRYNQQILKRTITYRS